MADNTGVRLIQEEEATPTVRIPLPPQLKDEVERQQEQERTQVAIEQARPAAPPVQVPVEREQLKAELAAARVALDEAKTRHTKQGGPLRCPSCGASLNRENASFSFCTHCGADLPKAGLRLETETAPPIQATYATGAQGVRDPRLTMRKIAELHQGQAQQHYRATEARRDVNPTLHAILSFIFPGVGQILNGQTGKGVLLILAAFVAVMIGLSPFGIPMLIARSLLAIDAYRIGEKRRNGISVGDGDWDVA